ncbi:hypothetical protein HPP92_006763 [Vanilla planifolia]|uniref:Acyl-CoA oxidase n=1 Tax=Vanilla planifolia TaxID=51239 RepID=A0A835RL21_VANPL|nr:hypothetical protein HPP92_006763 [Vanilla planifolia]
MATTATTQNQGYDTQDCAKSNVGLPALEISAAFPQATPATLFPPIASDYYQFDDLLNSEERSLRKRVREVMEKEVAPIMAEYWEKAEFPFHVIPKLAALNVAGGTMKGYGCPGLSIIGSAVAMAELARVDASCSTFVLVHSSLAMLTIGLCGSDVQKEKYLPSLARFDTVACWALTEPDYGSDASSLSTTATKVFVPEEDRLPGVNSFQDTNKVLAVSRVMVALATNRHINGCVRHVPQERKQFGAPLAAFQINQEKLVRMLGNIQAMLLVGWRLCKLYESGKMTPGHASLGKAWNSSKARETVSLGRELLGGNGILADFLVAKAFCDLEPIYSYEGTYEINSMVTGREITGFASFKPALLGKVSRL